MSMYGFPSHRSRPSPLAQNQNNPGIRTPRQAYYEPAHTEPNPAEGSIHPNDGEGVVSSQGKSFGQGSAHGVSSEGLPAVGLEFGKGFEERKKAQSLPQSEIAYAEAAKKENPTVGSAGVSPAVALSGIVLSEILGPPKGRAYFNRRFGR